MIYFKGSKNNLFSNKGFKTCRRLNMKKHTLTSLIISLFCSFSLIGVLLVPPNSTEKVNADILNTGWVSADGGATTINNTTSGISATFAGWGSRIRTVKKLSIDGLTFDIIANLGDTQRCGFYFSTNSNAYPTSTGGVTIPFINLANIISWNQSRMGFQSTHAARDGEVSGTVNMAYSSPTGDTLFTGSGNDGSAVLNISSTQKFRIKINSANNDRYEISVHELQSSIIWGNNPNFGLSELTGKYCFRAYINKSSFETSEDGTYYFLVYGFNNVPISIENVNFNAAYKEVVDGVVGGETKYTQVNSGSVPDALSNRYGYTFDGWYADSTLKTPLEKVEDSETIIYAKYSSVVSKSYSFDTNQSNFAGEDAYLYAFTSNGSNAPWPGIKLTMTDGVSNLVAVPYDATFVINNGGNGKQSQNITQSGLDEDICYIVYEDSSNKGYWASKDWFYVLGNATFNQSIGHSGEWGNGGNIRMETAEGTDKAYLLYSTEYNNVEIRTVKGNNVGYNWLNSANYEGILISKSGDNIKLQKGSYKLFVNQDETLYVSVTVETLSSQLTRMLRANCNASGEGSNLQGIKHIWNNIIKDYNTIQTQSEKDLLAKADSTSEQVYRDAAELYDLIYSKYHTSLSLTDFLGRYAEGSTVVTFYSLGTSLAPLIGLTYNNSSLVVVIISVVSISVLAAFVFARKRKRQ